MSVTESSPHSTAPVGCFLEESGQEHLDIRIYTVALAGTTIGVVNIANNALVMYLFARHLRCFHCEFVYMFVMGVCDCVIAVCYIVTFPLDIVNVYFMSEWTFVLFHRTIVGAMCVGYIAIMTNTLLMLVASVDRCLSCYDVHHMKMRHRVAMIIWAIAVSCLLKVRCAAVKPTCAGVDTRRIRRSARRRLCDCVRSVALH